jgi:hypothetical protein
MYSQVHITCIHKFTHANVTYMADSQALKSKRELELERREADVKRNAAILVAKEQVMCCMHSYMYVCLCTNSDIFSRMCMCVHIIFIHTDLCMLADVGVHAVNNILADGSQEDIRNGERDATVLLPSVEAKTLTTGLAELIASHEAFLLVRRSSLRGPLFSPCGFFGGSSCLAVFVLV